MRWILYTLFAACIAFLPMQAVLAADTITESKLEAAFVYQFPKFISWPQALQTKQFSIAVLGDGVGGKMLEKLAGKPLKGTTLRVQRCEQILCAEQFPVVFFTGRYDEIPGLLSRLKYKPVLTICKTKGFAARGGMIELVKQQHRLTFIINRNAISKAHLRINPQLLSMALRVLEEE